MACPLTTFFSITIPLAGEYNVSVRRTRPVLRISSTCLTEMSHSSRRRLAAASRPVDAGGTPGTALSPIVCSRLRARSSSSCAATSSGE